MSDLAEGVVLYLDLAAPQAGPERSPGARRLVRCPDCGSVRYASAHPHAPRVTPAGRVDCLGRAIP